MGKVPAAAKMVPVDLSVVDQHFEDEEDDLVDEKFRLDVAKMIEKLGTKGTAEALIKAKDRCDANSKSKSADDKPETMTAAQYRENVDDDDLEDMEEEDDEDDEEEEPEEPEPKTKKAKKA